MNKKLNNSKTQKLKNSKVQSLDSKMNKGKWRWMKKVKNSKTQKLNFEIVDIIHNIFSVISIVFSELFYLGHPYMTF